jgi:molybdate transport system permease protein
MAYDFSPFILSLQISTVTTVTLLFCSPFLAWWITRTTSPLRHPLRIFINAPLVLPPSVLGFYFLLSFGPSSHLGALFEYMFHTRLLFTFEGLLLGSILINIPFMMNPLISGMESLPKSLIDASYVLGKSKLETFVKIVLPSVIPSFLAGSVMTFIHSMGEFGLVLMIGGKIPGKTVTASIAVFDSVESLRYDQAHMYALALVIISFLILSVLFILNKKIRIL